MGLGEHPFNSVALDGTALHSKPLLPQAENVSGDGFNDTSLITFNLNSVFFGVANKPVSKNWEVDLR